jgi:hypothetical protein
VRETYRALVAQGLGFLTPPPPPWGGWRCFAQDPGYIVEFEQQ